MGWSDPAPRTTEPKPIPDTWQPHHVQPTRKLEWSSNVEPPPLQPNGRHRHKATGWRDATPTSSIAISTWDAETEWRATMMKPLPPPGLPRLQSAAPHLRFQPAAAQAPVTTDDVLSSDFNRRCPRAPISTDGAVVLISTYASPRLITTGSGSTPISAGVGPGSNFNLKIPIRTIAYMSSIIIF
jgi:hypothetical protein